MLIFDHNYLTNIYDRKLLFKWLQTSQLMSHYQVNRLKSVSREEISWNSIFDISVSGKHDLYSGHNVG